MALLCFMKQHWADLSDAVQQQVTTSMPLLGADADMLSALNEGGSATSAAAGSASNSRVTMPGPNGSSNGSYADATRSVYALPAAGSLLLPLLQALHFGGASFLHPMYGSGGVAGLTSWLLDMKMALVLTHTEAAQYLQQAHKTHAPDTWQWIFSPAQMAWQALAVALWGDAGACRQVLLLAVQGLCMAGSSPAVEYRTAEGQQPVYFPATGHGWALQEVLLPGQVPYLHPAYAQLLSDLQQRNEDQHYRALLHLLEIELNIQMRPMPGASLQQAVGPPASASQRSKLLLLLGDEWGNYEPRVQEEMTSLLSHIQVGQVTRSPHHWPCCVQIQGLHTRC
jgi:hypothetical protein